MKTPVDHLIFATPNLSDGIEQLETLLGVPAIAGGSHPGLGTCNALFRLGPTCYLEVMGPDPTQTDFQGARPFGIDALASGRLVTWVARREGLSQFVQAMGLKSIELGNVIPFSRQTPQGELLNWEMAFLTNIAPELMTVLPLFIDWGQTPNPALQCSEGAQLINLEIVYPRLAEILPLVDALELDVRVKEGAKPGIRAIINCPRGEIELSTFG